MKYVIVITDSYRHVLSLANELCIPWHQLIFGYHMEKLRGIERGTKYIVVGGLASKELDRDMAAFIESRQFIKIKPEDIRAELEVTSS